MGRIEGHTNEKIREKQYAPQLSVYKIITLRYNNYIFIKEKSNHK